jgi:hypothetical protein
LTDGQLFRDPDPEVHRRRDGDEKRLPGWLVADLLRAELARLRGQLLAEPYSPPPDCSIRGCQQPGVEQHHWAERADFGDFAERCPITWVCKYHHDLIGAVRRARTQGVRQ